MVDPMRSERPRACVLGEIETVRPLALAGIRSAVVAQPRDPARYSRFVDTVIEWIDPWTEPTKLVDRLLEYAQTQHERPVLYYDGDWDLLLVSRYREALAEGFRFVAAETELVDDLVAKDRFQALADRLDLPVPPARRLDLVDDQITGELDLNFPIILKPLTRQHIVWKPLSDAKAIRFDDRHNLMAIGLLSDERCIPLGQTAMRWTRSVLSAKARAYLKALPSRAEAPGGLLVAHGSLDDIERYTTSVDEAVDQLAQVERDYSGARILVLGHTHRPLVVGSGSRREQQRQKHLALSVGERYVVNPGGVGQARELRCRARFGVLDLDSNTLELEATRYNVASCRRELRNAGLSPRSCHLRPSAAGAARRGLRSIRRELAR
jgi:hypothetical protein